MKALTNIPMRAPAKIIIPAESPDKLGLQMVASVTNIPKINTYDIVIHKSTDVNVLIQPQLPTHKVLAVNNNDKVARKNQINQS